MIYQSQEHRAYATIFKGEVVILLTGALLTMLLVEITICQYTAPVGLWGGSRWKPGCMPRVTGGAAKTITSTGMEWLDKKNEMT